MTVMTINETPLVGSPVLVSALHELALYHNPTAEHSLRVGQYSRLLAQRFGADDQLAHRGGLGHDLGKLDVSLACLDAVDFGPRERGEMSQHTLTGFRRLCGLGLWEEAAVAGLHHSTQPNGYGVDAEIAYRNVDRARRDDVAQVVVLVHLADFADALFTRHNRAFTPSADVHVLSGVLRAHFEHSAEQVEFLLTHLI